MAGSSRVAVIFPVGTLGSFDAFQAFPGIAKAD
jgi:hypothetical protein